MLDVVLHLLHLSLDRGDLLVHRLGVELGDLADRLLHELVDVVHDDLPAQEILVVPHLGEDIIELLLPALLVLLEDLVHPVLEEYALKGIVVPLVLQLTETDLELPLENVPCVERVVDEYVLDREELRLVVHDHAGVRGYVALAVGEGVQGVDRLVRGHIVGKVDYDLHLVSGHVLDLLDLDLALLLGLDDRVLDDLGGLAVGNLGDRYGVLVNLLDLRADLDASASRPVLVIAAVRAAACGEIGIDGEILAFKDVN